MIPYFHQTIEPFGGKESSIGSKIVRKKGENHLHVLILVHMTS